MALNPDFVRSAEISEDGQSGVWPALVLKREGGGSGAGSLKATSAATSSRQSPVRESLRKHSSRGGSPRQSKSRFWWGSS